MWLGPAGVSGPRAVNVGPTYIGLQWSLPTLLNGQFTGFALYQSPTTRLYSGALTTFNVTNLTVRYVMLRYVTLRYVMMV